MVKNLIAIQETQIRSLGQEDSLEKGMATHSHILAWRTAWTGYSLGGLQSMVSHRVGHNWATDTLLFLLQGIFLTQGSNPGLLHCRQILYHGATLEAQGVVRRPKWHHPCQGQHLAKGCYYNHAHRAETEISVFPLFRSSGHRPSSSRSNTSFFRNRLRKKAKSQEQASSSHCPSPWGVGRDIYQDCGRTEKRLQECLYRFPPSCSASLSYVFWKVKVKSLSRVLLFATLWKVAYQALPSMGFSRQEYWSGLREATCWVKNLCPGLSSTVSSVKVPWGSPATPPPKTRLPHPLPRGPISWAPHLGHEGSGQGCVLWVCVRRSGPGCRAWGRQQGAGRCGWRDTGRGVSRACSATGTRRPPRLASAGTSGCSTGAACVGAGSSASPGAARLAVGSGPAPPRCPCPEWWHWWAGPPRPTCRPRQARLPLLETQCQDVRVSMTSSLHQFRPCQPHPKTVTHPQAPSAASQPYPQVPRLPSCPARLPSPPLSPACTKAPGSQPPPGCAEPWPSPTLHLGMLLLPSRPPLAPVPHCLLHLLHTPALPS